MYREISEELLDFLGYGGRYSFIVPNEIPKELHPGQTESINVNIDLVGFVGNIHPEVENEDVYVMEINLDKLLNKRVDYVHMLCYYKCIKMLG